MSKLAVRVVLSCSQCPMEYDGYCKHPDAPKVERYRLTDCEEYTDSVHPFCPLRAMSLMLKVGT